MLYMVLVCVLLCGFLYLYAADNGFLNESFIYLDIYQYYYLKYIVLGFTFFHAFVWTGLILLLLASEGWWSNRALPFAVMRRRIDIPDQEWESQYFIFLDQTPDETRDYDEFHNSYFTSDGYFPQSYRNSEEFNIEALKQRRNLKKTIIVFLRKWNHLWGGVPEAYSFESPPTIKSRYDLSLDDDFDTLGITLTAGSAVDASSYIWDIEYPVVFPDPAKDKIEYKYHPQLLRKIAKYPEGFDVNLNNVPYLDEYPLNIGHVSIKRNWEDNPAALTFRDLDKALLNLIRLPIKLKTRNTITSFLTPDYFLLGRFMPFLFQLPSFLFNYYRINTRRARDLFLDIRSEFYDTGWDSYNGLWRMRRLFASVLKLTTYDKPRKSFSLSRFTFSKHKSTDLVVQPLDYEDDEELNRHFYRMQYFMRTHLMWSKKNFTPHPQFPQYSGLFLEDMEYEVEPRTGEDVALPPLEFEMEDDRFSSDFESVQSLLNNDVIRYNDVDLFKPNHFFEYEYLLEGEDVFEQSIGEFSLAPTAGFLVCAALIGHTWFPPFLHLILFGAAIYCYFLADNFEAPLFRTMTNSALPHFTLTQKEVMIEDDDVFANYQDYALSLYEVYLDGSPELAPFVVYKGDNELGGSEQKEEIEPFEDDIVGQYEQMGEDDDANMGFVFNFQFDDYPKRDNANYILHDVFDWYWFTRFFYYINKEIDDDEMLTRWWWKFPQSFHGVQPEEGDSDGHIEGLLDAGEVDEGLGHNSFVEFVNRGRIDDVSPTYAAPLKGYGFFFFPITYVESGAEEDFEDEMGIGSDPEDEYWFGADEPDCEPLSQLEDEDDDDSENAVANQTEAPLRYNSSFFIVPPFLPHLYHWMQLKYSAISYFRSLHWRKLFTLYKDFYIKKTPWN